MQLLWEKMLCYKTFHYILLVCDVYSEIHKITNTDIQYLTMVDISDTKLKYIKKQQDTLKMTLKPTNIQSKDYSQPNNES